MNFSRVVQAVSLAALMFVTGSAAYGQQPRTGGWLTLRLREDLPQGFAIHESPTISTMWPAMPCFSNLALFDPLKPTHSVDTVIGELAEWRLDYFTVWPHVKNLVPHHSIYGWGRLQDVWRAE